MSSFNENKVQEESTRRIKGVCCDVKNCVHHEGECDCTANRIAVGPSYASSCTDTVCATFKQKGI